MTSPDDTSRGAVSSPEPGRAGPSTTPAQLVHAVRAHPAPMAVLQGPDGVLWVNDACAELRDEQGRPADGQPWRTGWPALYQALGGAHLSGPAEGLADVVTPAGQRRYRCRSAPMPPGDAALVVLEPVTSPTDPGAAGSATATAAAAGAAAPAPGATNPEATRTAPHPVAQAPAAPAPAEAAAPPSAATTARATSRDQADDLADLASLDGGTIRAALGRLVVPAHTPRAIIWQRTTDRMGRNRLDRRDVPARGRRRAGGSSALADRLGVEQVLLTGTVQDRRLSRDEGWPAARAVTLPLRSKRRVVGALTLEEPGQRPFDREQLAYLQGLADRAGVALANAARFRIEHSISRDLQRLLAPRALPSMRGVDIAAQLIAGSPGVTVGGDWYDACETPDGRLAVTIGDVVGHGLGSAIEMTQLRTGLRNLAMEGLEPAEVLAGADEFLRRTGEARFVTCIHAVYRPESGRLDMANSGHLRPVVLPADGRPQPVSMGPGLPLGGAADLARGANRAAVGTCRIVLHPGDAVLMFTDGLVESRSRTADQGVAQLVEMLRTIGHDSHGGPPYARRRHRPTRSGPRARELCARVLAEMGAGGDDDRDDVALLVLRRRRQRR